MFRNIRVLIAKPFSLKHVKFLATTHPAPLSALNAESSFSKLQIKCRVIDLDQNRPFSTSLSKDPMEQNRNIRKSIEKSSAFIKEAKIIDEKSFLKIEWKADDSSSSYPFLWLRDNCQCESCFHSTSRSRTFLFNDLKIDIKPLNVKINGHRTSVEIEWNDGHSSVYDAKWLQERNFEKGGQYREQRENFCRLPKIRWGSEITGNLPRAKFQDLLNEDRALLSCLQLLEIYGFVLIHDSPSEYGQVRRLAERIAFIKRTHYGAEFCVKLKPDASNVAYLDGPLQFHTDLPYYEYKPGVQFIHCIVQYKGDGGESIIADASHVAMELKKNYPQYFECLSSTNVDWYDVGIDEGREFCKVLRKPVLCLDSSGEIIRVNYSQPQRDSFFNVDLDIVNLWYKAMLTFHKMLYDPKYCIRFKMKPGTIQVFDNLRIVHGRTEYTSGPGDREIEGCYVDWDEVRSKRRVLERKISRDRAE